MSFKKVDKTKKFKKKINKSKLWAAFDNEQPSKEAELILVYEEQENMFGLFVQEGSASFNNLEWRN